MKLYVYLLIYLKDGTAVSGFGSEERVSEVPVEELAAGASDGERMSCWFLIFRKVMRSMTGRSGI